MTAIAATMTAMTPMAALVNVALVGFVALASWGCRAPAPPPPPTSPPVVATTPQAAPVEPRAPWDPWNDAAVRGIDFRAVGNEPGWYLEVDHEGVMRILWSYGEQQATVPATKPTVRGSVTTFESSAGGHALRADIAPGPCNDGMSDQSYPLNVIVVVNGSTLRGCGRWLTKM